MKRDALPWIIAGLAGFVLGHGAAIAPRQPPIPFPQPWDPIVPGPDGPGPIPLDPYKPGPYWPDPDPYPPDPYPPNRPCPPGPQP